MDISEWEHGSLSAFICSSGILLCRSHLYWSCCKLEQLPDLPVSGKWVCHGEYSFFFSLVRRTQILVLAFSFFFDWWFSCILCHTPLKLKPFSIWVSVWWSVGFSGTALHLHLFNLCWTSWTAAAEKVVSQKLTPGGLPAHQACFCEHRESVRKYQASHCLAFSYGLFTSLNSSELGLEIITLNSYTAWEEIFLKVFVLVKYLL